MSSLVGTVKRKLECSSDEAVWRIIAISLLFVATVAVIATVFVFFPYQGEKTQYISILPGSHVELLAILDGENLVDGDKFLEVAEGNKTFIALGDNAISYMVEDEGISYRHSQPVHLDARYDVHDQEIQDDTVIRILHKRTDYMWGMFIAYPALVLVVMFLLFMLVTHRRGGTYSNPEYKGLFDKS